MMATPPNAAWRSSERMRHGTERMELKADGLREYLARRDLIAILRGVRPEEVEAIAAALESSGIAIVEVPLNSPDPMDRSRRRAGG
jgi:hypothetical protein